MSVMTTLPMGPMGTLDGWTLDDLPEDRAYELIDGCLVVSPYEHAMNLRSAARLTRILTEACPPGFDVVPGGVGFHLAERTLIKPDLLVLRSSAVERGHGTPGDVLLVVECLSPSSRTMDRVTKPALCAEAGVGAYWLLERLPDPALTTYDLSKGEARPGERYTDIVEVTEPLAVRFRVGDLLT